MDAKMFCFQCEETCANKGCTIRGMCGKEPETANSMDRLIAELKRLAVALENKGMKPDAGTGTFMMQAMFATITNANFDTPRIEEFIRETQERTAKIDPSVPLPPVGVLAEKNEDIRSLKELLTYGLKGICAYADHAAVLDFKDETVDAFLVRALAALTRELSAEELTSLVLECGNTAVAAMALLDKANTTTFGRPEITKVKTGIGKNPGILISGHDLLDLKELLEQTAGTGVDVYTHGEMLPAHYYPFFRKYPNLVGNYGGSWYMQNKEFGPFNGPILMTTNCIVPVQDAYKNRIFTTGVVGYPGVKHIPARKKGGHKDFSEIIALAKTCKAPEQLDDLTIVGGFAHDQVLALADKIVDAVKSGAIKRFIVMAGCDGRYKKREYFTQVAEKLPKDTVILTAGCAKYRYNKLNLGDIGGIPRVLDAGQCNDSYSLAVIALKLKEVFGLADVNDLPLSFDIAWYEQKAVAVLLALLALGFKNIRLGPTLPGFLSPGVAGVLVRNFGIKGTTEPDADIRDMVG